MTIDPEKLAAFVDGELNAIDAARIDRAIAADPALAAQLAAHRTLKDTLAYHYAPVAAEPVPDRLAMLLQTDDHVVDLGKARAARETHKQRFRLPVWAMGSAVAASLVVGIGIGTNMSNESMIATRNGSLVAENTLDRALTTQLASAQGEAPIRILVSFRDTEGSLCRGFDGAGAAGIACRNNDSWVVRRVQNSEMQAATGYRQAGSTASEILAAAQDMAVGSALDAEQEKAARDASWKSR